MPKPRVLIVDDYPGARYRCMRLLLDDGGFDVADEALGRDAIRRLASERFDLLIVDLHLQDISGLDVVRGVRSDARLANLPILMMSTVSNTDEAARLAKDVGVTAFLGDADDTAFVSAVRQAIG